MRRVTVLTAGLMLATGASLALAGPAAAASPGNGQGRQCCGHPGGGSYQDRYYQDRGPSWGHRQPSFRQNRQPSFGRQGNQGNHGNQGNQGNRGNQPSRPNTPNYLINISNISVINQILLNNIGNTQIGSGNSNGGGTAVNSATQQ